MQFSRAVDFPLTKPCGDTVCPNFFICSATDHQCHNCKTFCTETDNNYDKEICERHCPGLHDINLECSEILIIVIAVLLIILFAMMAGMVFYWLRRARRNKWTLRFTVDKRVSETDGKMTQNLDTLITAHATEPPKLQTFMSIFGPRTNSTWTEDEKNVKSIDNKKETTTQKSGYDNLGLRVPSEQF